MQLEECYRRLKAYCADIDPMYQYMSWTHARRLRDAAHFRRRLIMGTDWHHWECYSCHRSNAASARELETEARFIELKVLYAAYSAIRPGIQTQL